MERPQDPPKGTDMQLHTAEPIARKLDRIALHLVEAFRDEHRVETVLQAVNRSYRNVTALSAKSDQVAALIEQDAREYLANLEPETQRLATA